jgi:hypothetical protein
MTTPLFISRIFKRCCAFSLLLLMVSCTNTGGKKLKPKDAARLRSATLVAYGHGGPAGCTVTTLGQTFGTAALAVGAGVAAGPVSPAMSGVIAGGMVNGGWAVPRGDLHPGATDPSKEIAQKLGAALAKAHGMKVVSQFPRFPPANTATDLATAFSNVDFVLGVSSGFNATAFLRNPKRYRVDGYVTVNLVDAKTRKRIASAFYSSMPEYESNSPTHDELTKGDQPGLKRAVEKHEAQALQRLMQQLQLVP